MGTLVEKLQKERRREEHTRDLIKNTLIEQSEPSLTVTAETTYSIMSGDSELVNVYQREGIIALNRLYSKLPQNIQTLIERLKGIGYEVRER